MSANQSIWRSAVRVGLEQYRGAKVDRDGHGAKVKIDGTRLSDERLATFNAQLNEHGARVENTASGLRIRNIFRSKVEGILPICAAVIDCAESVPSTPTRAGKHLPAPVGAGS